MAFPETSILDDFNRSDEGPPPSASWTNVENGLEVISNQCRGDQIGAGNWSNWNVETFGPDCEVYTTLADLGAINVYLRMNTVDTNDDGYRITAYNDEQIVQRHDNGSGTQLGAAISQTMADGDKHGASMVGSTITVYFDDGGAGWGATGTRSDGTYTVAGYIGSRLYSNIPDIDDFGGGTIAGVGNAPTGVLRGPFGGPLSGPIM